MLLVIVHAEVFLDPELEHRTVPNPTTEAGSLWASLDDLLELCQLLIAQAHRWPWRIPCPQPLHPSNVVPTNPLFDSRQGHVEFDWQLSCRLAMNIAQHCTAPTPCPKVGLGFGFLKSAPPENVSTV